MDDEGQIEEPLRVSVGLMAMMMLACFVSAIALASNVCGLLSLPIWVAVAFGFVVVAFLWRLIGTISHEARSWRISSSRWDIAELVVFVSFGLLAWRRRTGSWSFYLPSSQSVDMVHHLALSDYLSRTGHIPRGIIGYLGPMVGYPPGSHIVAVFVQWISRSEITSALTFTAWWMCISWGFFVGGIAKWIIGGRGRWVGVVSFPLLCVASDFTLGQVTGQFYFSQIVGGFVFLAFITTLCLSGNVFALNKPADGIKRMRDRQQVMLRCIGMLLLAGLPAVYPLALLSAGAVVGCAWLLVGLGFMRLQRTRPSSALLNAVSERVDAATPAKIRHKRSIDRLAIEAGWLVAGALLGIGLWLPLGLATSNTMISQEGGLAELTLRNVGGPIGVAVGIAGLVTLARKARRIGANHTYARCWSGRVVLVTLFAVVTQIALLSLGKALGLPVTRYYVLKGMYFAVPLFLTLILCGFVSCFEKMEVALERTVRSPTSATNRRWLRRVRNAGKGLLVIGAVGLLITSWSTASALQPTDSSFDSDMVWLAQQARLKLPEKRLGVVTDPATSYLAWNALFRQQRGDDPLATYDSFAKTNRWANWPDNSVERYLLTTNVLAEQYLKNDGVRIAGIRGDAVLLSGEEQGRVRRVTGGALALPSRKDPTIHVTDGMQKVFPSTVSYIGSNDSASKVRKLLAIPKQTFTNLPDRFVSEDGFRLLAMSRSQTVPLPAILFAEALRVGQYDDGVTAAITELVAVVGADANEFDFQSAIDPAAMFAWASISPDGRLKNWRGQYLALAAASQQSRRAIFWDSAALVFTYKGAQNIDLGSVSAAEACGVKLTPRRTLALRALSITLAQRTDLQASFGTTRHPKLGSLIEWASAASDSDASKLLPFWPELQVIAAVCRKGFD